jgi:hypothetical protein
VEGVKYRCGTCGDAGHSKRSHATAMAKVAAAFESKRRRATAALFAERNELRELVGLARAAGEYRDGRKAC